MKMVRGQLWVSVLVCLSFAASQADARSGTVSGRVIDEGGTPLANGLGDTDLARASFQRFLALAPDDHVDRGTAQELLNYLKN